MWDKLYSPKIIEEIRRSHDFHLSKSLGQNFITDPGIIGKIVEGAEIGPDDMVIEIGPGIGVLTRELAGEAAAVTAIEIDSRLVPILEETLADYDNISVINEDVLKVDINSVTEEARRRGDFGGDVKIIGNLPYYITTPIIMKLLEKGVEAESITVMMQKEVADRISAKPGTKAYGALTVAVGYYCCVEKITDVSRECFVPRPNVDSSVLRLEVRKDKPVELKDRELFFECIKKGFGQRRKTLLNSMTGLAGLEKNEIKGILESLEIDPGRRAETLSIEEFAAIANLAAEKGSTVQ